MKTAKTYCLRVRGHLDPDWSEWFNGMTIKHEANGETTLTGVVPDQAALHGLLARVHGLGLELVAVGPCSGRASRR
ncbi:MAG: hypothetical protein IT318_08095 [Anaerolineales bacterium]|nr:hypothetical protein [Anaerolineales bacterium]